MAIDHFLVSEMYKTKSEITLGILAINPLFFISSFPYVTNVTYCRINVNTLQKLFSAKSGKEVGSAT